LRSPSPFHGAVVDWLRIEPYGPTFNLADVALRAGGLLLLFGLLRRSRDPAGVDAGESAGERVG